MEDFEKSIKEHNLKQMLKVETEFDTSIESELEKARSGIYKPSKENLKQGRAGERYGNMINGGSEQNLDKDHEEKIFQLAAKVYDKLDYKDLGNERKIASALKDLKHVNNLLVVRMVKRKIKEIIDKDTAGKKAVEDTLENARAGIYAPTGENKKKGVVGQKYGSKKPEEPGKGNQPAGEEPKLSEEQLKEHATQSSEQALTNAIKQSPDPVVRQVAHAELQRRAAEEKPQSDKDKDVFPKKDVQEGASKEQHNQMKQLQEKDKKEQSKTLGKQVSEAEKKKFKEPDWSDNLTPEEKERMFPKELSPEEEKLSKVNIYDTPEHKAWLKIMEPFDDLVHKQWDLDSKERKMKKEGVKDLIQGGLDKKEAEKFYDKHHEKTELKEVREKIQELYKKAEGAKKVRDDLDKKIKQAQDRKHDIHSSEMARLFRDWQQGASTKEKRTMERKTDSPFGGDEKKPVKKSIQGIQYF